MTSTVYPANNLSKDNYKPGKNWELLWGDEFDKDEIDPLLWNFQEEPAGRFNKEWQRYVHSSHNAYIENGCLVLKAIHHGKKHCLNAYTSARLNTAGKFSFKYGKIAARIQLPYGKGIWPAFWLLGANIDENGGDTPWPFCGEIDILELYGTKDDAAIEVNVHYANNKGKHSSMGAISHTLDSGKFADAFHIFELEWDETCLKWYVDGKEIATKEITEEQYAAFHQEYFILLNIAVGGEWAGRPDANTSFPQMMVVDWIRVYHKK
jgi:beta-glucanase (GH16 family)